MNKSVRRIEENELNVLAFLRNALLGEAVSQNPLSPQDWEECFRLATVHGVVPLVFSGASSRRKEIPSELLKKCRLQTISQVVNTDNMLAFQSDLINMLDVNGIKCAILKGTSLSIYYPQKELRPLGDIDLLISPADRGKVHDLMNKMGYHSQDTGHPFHLDYYGSGPVVEVHWAASTFPDSIGGQTTKNFMDSALCNTNDAVIDGHSFPMLMPTFQAISLLLHMERHMIKSCIGLRQLCDWMMFVNSLNDDIIHNALLPLLTKCGLLQFAQVMTKTCSIYLGLPQHSTYWCSDVDRSVCNRMMLEILRGGNIREIDNEREVSGMLVGNDHDGWHRGALRIVIERLTELTKSNFPITKRFSFLLPVFWLYIPMRYGIRIMRGQRQHFSVARTISEAGRRRKLYEELRLFKV